MVRNGKDPWKEHKIPGLPPAANRQQLSREGFF
jgi:hypothetical protein